jgi:hypothetical protein
MGGFTILVGKYGKTSKIDFIAGILEVFIDGPKLLKGFTSRDLLYSRKSRKNCWKIEKN